MITILTHLAIAILGFVIGVFVYRNNTDLVGKKAEEVDQLWDRLGLTDKFEKLEKKVDELLDRK